MSTLKPLPESPKVLDLLQAGERLIKRFGYKRITVEEICTEAQVSKMTFYKYFDNKKTLMLYILDGIFSSFLTKFEELMQEPISYAEKIRRMVAFKLDQLVEDDFTFVEEIMEADPDIQVLIADIQVRAAEMQAQAIEQAREAGEIHDWVTPEIYMVFLNHIANMIQDPLIHSFFKNDYRKMSETVTRFILHGFLHELPEQD